MSQTEQPHQTIEVVSVKIVIKGKNIELPIAQALELRDILNATFPPEKKPEYVYIQPTTQQAIPAIIIEQPTYPQPFGPFFSEPSWVPYAGGTSLCLNETR